MLITVEENWAISEQESVPDFLEQYNSIYCLLNVTMVNDKFCPTSASIVFSRPDANI